jgi:RES domain
LPAIEPPAECPGRPVTTRVPAGSVLFRVHRDTRRPYEFNPAARWPTGPGVPVEGGRFDSDDGSYAYLYAAVTEAGAFAESFARDLDYTAAGPRPLPRARVARKEVSAVFVQRDLQVVETQAAAAQQLGQDDWLTTCDEGGYPLTRRWARAIRRWVPSGDGLEWRSKRDPTQRVLVLWGDPTRAADGCGLLAPEPDLADTTPLDEGIGRVRLAGFLARWRLYLER